MSRRRALAVATTSSAAVVLAALAVAGGGGGPDASTSRDEGVAGRRTAEVTTRDLVEREDLDGTIGYGDGRELVLPRAGTITALPAEGTVVDRGGSLGEVDGVPVSLLLGDGAFWRPLDASSPDGDDIRALEENLVAMGYGTAARLGPDEHWTSATTAAVERWQEDLGVDETGRLDLGAAVLAPAPLRVARHLAAVGDRADGPALEVTATTRIVTVDLAASRRQLVAPGQAVEVELVDGQVVDGVVYSVADVVEPPAQEGGEPTIEVVVAFADDAPSGVAEFAPVDVHVVTTEAPGALTVPVEALLALAEGGYAVERSDGSLVGVELGAHADGYVEVRATSGTLEEGDQVVVAG